ncbi:MAG: hypothetical protein Kow00117_10930 [Phototrophicales bacterium]
MRLILIFLLIAFSTIAQEATEEPPTCQINTAPIITLLEEAQTAADAGDFDAAREALNAAEDALNTLQAACEPPLIYDNTPEGLAQALLDATFKGDIERIFELSCQADVALAGDIDFDEMQAAIQQVDVDLSRVEYELVLQTEDYAEVAILGEIILSIGDVEQTIPADQFGGNIPVVLENERWVLCESARSGE